MKKRTGIHTRIAAVFSQDGLRIVRGWQGGSRAIFVNGERCNAAILRELKATAEARLGFEVSPAAVEKALARLAIEESKAAREERQRTTHERKATKKAADKAASVQKLHEKALKRHQAHNAKTNAAKRPPRADWFDQFTFDGVTRLDRFAEEFLGATAHDSRMFAAFMIGACRRFGATPGSPLIVNAAFAGVAEAEVEAGLRTMFEPFFGTYFDADADAHFFVPRTEGNFVIFVRKDDRRDRFAFEILARRTHDVAGDSLRTPRTFVLAVADEEVPPYFRKIELRRMDLEAIHKYRTQLIAEAKARALRPIKVDAERVLRARRARWLREYSNLSGGNNA